MTVWAALCVATCRHQLLVARLVHVMVAPDTDTQYRFLLLARKYFGQVGGWEPGARQQMDHLILRWHSLIIDSSYLLFKSYTAHTFIYLLIMY